jgi:hypothetical protein
MVGFQGNFDLFAQAFPNALVPSVFGLMLSEWPNAPRPTGNPLENRITNLFVGHLQRAMRNYEFPQFKFTLRPKAADPEADSESGEFDIAVDSFSRRPDAFLIVECKRLNVETNTGFRSGAGSYIGDEGMGCFISGQYQSGGNIGGMLGYVMTRSIDDAIEAINQQLAAGHKALRIQQPFELQESAIVANEPHVRQTTHTLDDGDFEIVHLFVKF